MASVVFTALLGRYETLNPQPVLPDSAADRICFTDDPELTSNEWDVRLVEPLFSQDLVRSQRKIKILGSAGLESYDRWLYVDNTVILKQDPNVILDEWLHETDLAFPLHGFRDSLINEFDAVVTSGFDEPSRVYEQLMHYDNAYPNILLSKPRWNGLFARRNSREAAATMDIWFDHVLRYSRRDQLSSNVAIHLGPASNADIDIDMFESPFHSWPHASARRVAMGMSRPYSSGPLLAEIARRDRQIADLVEQGMSLRAEREVAVSDAEASRLSAARFEQSFTDVKRELDEITASSVWRSTAPLRRTGDGTRRALRFLRNIRR